MSHILTQRMLAIAAFEQEAQKHLELMEKLPLEWRYHEQMAAQKNQKAKRLRDAPLASK